MVMQLDRAVAAASATSPGPSPALSRRTYEVRRPAVRYLRGYAFDPSYSTQLATAFMNHVRFKVPWEENLEPGPVGEYVEVVDYDPPSRCFYEPVDLNQRWVLAQDGLPSSEGSPQFHQQMAYAVAMVTIRNFEHALGRRAFWRPLAPNEASPAGPDAGYEDYVPRLRIYPHALREANAYYSPQKRALDLAGRLVDEATRIAQIMLTICIRALDYCPPVNITFGDYLRALITADLDVKAPRFEVSVRLAQRAAPDGSVADQVVILLTQMRDIGADAATGRLPFKFRGGCTLIVDLRTLELHFRIVKRIDDDLRLQRQAKYMGEQELASLRATYLGALGEQYEQEPFALLHRQSGEEENL